MASSLKDKIFYNFKRRLRLTISLFVLTLGTTYVIFREETLVASIFEFTFFLLWPCVEAVWHEYKQFKSNRRNNEKLASEAHKAFSFIKIKDRDIFIISDEAPWSRQECYDRYLKFFFPK